MLDDVVVKLCSLRSAQEFLDRRKMTEFGSIALVDEGVGDGDGVQLSLPGVRRGRRQPSLCCSMAVELYLLIIII